MPPKTSKRTGLPVHWITELFKVFQSRYFAKWTKPIEGIEERAVKEWAAGLDGITGDQLKAGVDNWKNDWPPSLPEFKACCLGSIGDDDWKHKGGAYKVLPESKRLTQQKAQPEVQKAAMDEMRKKLGI